MEPGTAQWVRLSNAEASSGILTTLGSRQAKRRMLAAQSVTQSRPGLLARRRSGHAVAGTSKADFQ